MKLLDKLERKFGRVAIPNLTFFLVLTQSLAYFLAWSRPDLMGRLDLQANLVLHGEWWRLITFMIMPPFTNLVFAFFALYFFWLMGTALEHEWGEFRYNLYIFIGYCCAVATAFIEPLAPVSNGYIEGSVFLAFAFLYPDFVIYLFLILPIRIKWLALITWIAYGYLFIFSGNMTRLLIGASILNFLIFFCKPLLVRIRHGARHMANQSKELSERDKPFHVCATCGITDKTHPKMDFRYCPDCFGSPGYCEAHINNHEHRKAPAGKIA